MEAVDAALVEAIHQQRLRVAAEAMLDTASPADAALPLLRRAVEACEAISMEMLNSQTEVLGALNEANVSARPVAGPAEGRLQHHSLGVEVARGDLAATIEVVRSLGYVQTVELGVAAVGVLADRADRVRLIRFDDSTTRLNITFDAPPGRRIPKRLVPTPADLAAVDLPVRLAGLYYLIKPARVLLERVRGRRISSHETDFLGTPVGLIPNILDAVGVTSTDVLYDLGCGDGRIVIAAAEHVGCTAVGIDQNSDRVAQARSLVAMSPASDNIRVEQARIDDVDLSAATVIFVFMPKRQVAPLLARLRASVSRDTRIVVHEQTTIDSDVAPDRSLPIFNQSGVTVVHVWTGERVDQ